MTTKAEKVKDIQAILDNIYPKPPIPLIHKNPYELLVSVVLSAQTTDAMVNRVTPGLFSKAPTPEKLAALSVEEIKELINGIGLTNNKAKFLKGIGQHLVERFDGVVPQTFEELETLPGTGHKSASVVMSQGFGYPAFAIDTHIHRLAWRWKLSNGKSVEQTEKDLKRLFPKEHWNKLHLQIIYFGREHCPARGHDPRICPICSKYGRASMFE